MTFTEAIDRTLRAGTARFEGKAHEGGPRGPAPRRFARGAMGIVDFPARRAIVRDLMIPTGFWGGMAGRMRQLGPSEGPFLHFCEGPAMCSRLPRGGWSELHPRWPADLPRKPLELAFLDLSAPRAVLEDRAVGTEEVRGMQTDHVALTLGFERADWATPPRNAFAAGGDSILERLAIRVLPDPRPHGLVQAEIWIDQEGLMRRFSISGRSFWGPRAEALWLTTELWDFGGPPTIADRLSQPVIDPMTLQPVTTWRIRARPHGFPRR